MYIPNFEAESKFYKYLIIYFPHLSSLVSDDKTPGG